MQLTSVTVALEIMPPTPAVWLPIVGPSTGTLRVEFVSNQHVNATEPRSVLVSTMHQCAENTEYY